MCIEKFYVYFVSLQVRSDSKFDVKWLRETTEIDSTVDSRYTIKNVSRKCSLVLNKINEDDTGRYICEITNKAGKVSSYGRILVVNDPKILNADTRLKKRYRILMLHQLYFMYIFISTTTLSFELASSMG